MDKRKMKDNKRNIDNATDLRDFCRLCGSIDQPNVSLATAEQSLECVGIEVSRDQLGMPQRICRECKDRLKNYAAFHRQFQIMDEFFRGRLNSLRQANATSTPSTSQEDFQYRLTANGRVLKVFRIKHADGSVTYDERPSEPSPKKAGSSSQNSSRLPLDRKRKIDKPSPPILSTKQARKGSDSSSTVLENNPKLMDRIAKRLIERKAKTKPKSPTILVVSEHKKFKNISKSEPTDKKARMRNSTASKEHRGSLLEPRNANQIREALGLLRRCYIRLEPIDTSKYENKNEVKPLAKTSSKRATSTKKSHKKRRSTLTARMLKVALQNVPEYNPPRRRTTLPIITHVHSNIDPLITPSAPTTLTGVTVACDADLIQQEADIIAIKIEPRDEVEVEDAYGVYNDGVNYDDVSTLTGQNALASCEDSVPDAFTEITSEIEIDGYRIADYNSDPLDIAEEQDPLDIAEVDRASNFAEDIHPPNTEPPEAVLKGATTVLENETNNLNEGDIETKCDKPPELEETKNMTDAQPIPAERADLQISACDVVLNMAVAQATPKTYNDEDPQPTDQTQAENHVNDISTIESATEVPQMDDLPEAAGPIQPQVNERNEVNKSPVMADSSKNHEENCELTSGNGVIPQCNAEEPRISHENVPNLDFEAMLSAEAFDNIYKPADSTNVMRSSTFVVSESSLVPYADDDPIALAISNDDQSVQNSLALSNEADPLDTIRGNQTSINKAETESNFHQATDIPEHLVQLCESVANILDRIQDKSNETNGAEFK